MRYRYDEIKRRRLKTVEFIVEETSYTPKAKLIKPETIVGLQVGYEETEIKQLVKAAGAKWNPARRVWEIRYDKAVVLELTARIVPRSICSKANRSK